VTEQGRLALHLPPVLAELLGYQDITTQGATLRTALDNAASQYPALGLHLFDEAGQVRRHIRIVLNDTIILTENVASKAVNHGDQIAIINAVPGS